MAAMRHRQRIVPTAEEQLGSLPPLSPELARRFAREARQGCREIDDICDEREEIEALDADDLDDAVSASALDDDDISEGDMTRLFADLF